MLYYTLLTLLYSSVLYSTILYYTLLYYTILYYTALHYAILRRNLPLVPQLAGRVAKRAAVLPNGLHHMI